MNRINRHRTLALAAALALTMTAAALAGTHETRADLVDTAVAAGSFGTLVAAVEAAGLVETLRSEGPFTLFAPTDEAFAKLPAGTVEALLDDPDKLAQILTYHVVPGRLLAADVMAAGSLETAQGGRLTVDTTGPRVGNAAIVEADITTSNGVIHAIDTVLLP
jgi:uncharacterized surface protein with fasciclin (FAS1) repeats